MRYSGIIFLVLAVIVAGTATWLHSLWRTKEIFTETLDTSKIDYYLSDFSLYVIDGEGNNRLTISGEHFVHQRDTKTSDIYKPNITVNTKTDSLTIVANKAEQDMSGDITLKGMVNLHKPESEATTGFDLQTADLHYSPSKRQVFTDEKVTVKTTDGNEIFAIGMSEDLDTQTTRLKANVHAEYMPATSDSDE